MWCCRIVFLALLAYAITEVESSCGLKLLQLRPARPMKALGVVLHRIAVAFAAAHVVFESFGNLQDSLDVFHAEGGFLGERDRLTCLDRVLDL